MLQVKIQASSDLTCMLYCWSHHATWDNYKIRFLMKPASLETLWPMGSGRSFRGADTELKVPYSQERTRTVRLAQLETDFANPTAASLLIETNSS